MSFDEQDLIDFKAEATDLLETAEKSLLSLDQGADFRPMFDSVFRSLHNLKGGASMMELERLQEHAHEFENELMKFKDADSIPKPQIGVFLKAVDVARAILNNENVKFEFQTTIPPTDDISSPKDLSLDASSPSLDIDTSTTDISEASEISNPENLAEEFVAESEEILERISFSLQRLEKDHANKEEIDQLYREAHSLKGGAYLLSYRVLGDLAHGMESALEPIREGTHTTTTELFDILFKCISVIEKIIKSIKSTSSDTEFKNVVNLATQALSAVAARLPMHTAVSTTVPPPSEHDVHTQEPAAEHVKTSKDTESSNSIRVPTSLLDSLMNLMGEMVLVRNQVLQYSNKSDDPEFLSMSKKLNTITTEIQDEMMKTRMQPIGNILNKFNRVVRDLSHELGKNIQIVLSGTETELDKSLLESIKDPLTHIVRNACDHGIESTEARRNSKKSEMGTIHIKAYHEGGQVVVEIADDGKGLNRDTILNKAIEKGIVQSSQIPALSEKDIFNFIFAPGFSTAAQITNVSGRGVGMDVVRTNIEKIGGVVDIASSLGKGTTIKLKIPLTLAIVPALIVKYAQQTYAIPQVKLEELVRVDTNSNESGIEILHGVPVYRLRGNILPLVDLGRVLGLNQNTSDYKNKITNIAVLNAEHNFFGLIIDEIQDTADIVVKPLNRLLKSLQAYSGATILGDGSIALILDVMGISKIADISYETHGNHADSLQDNKQKNNQEIQDFLVVSLNSPTKHAIPLSYVHRLEEFRKTSVEYSGHQPVIRYRDVILPIVYANKALEYHSDSADSSEILSVIVIEKSKCFYGIVVNQIVDTLSTASEVELSNQKSKNIFGSLNTGDELIVIINPFELIAQVLPDINLISETPKNRIEKTVNNSAPHILLVEDTVFFRKTIRSILEKSGYHVTTATDGKEAIDILDSSRTEFSLIVSDIEMPNMNGFELAQKVRVHSKYADLPMLAVSSKADEKYLQRGLDCGFNLYLEKLNTENLLNSVHSLLNLKKEAV